MKRYYVERLNEILIDESLKDDNGIGSKRNQKLYLMYNCIQIFFWSY